VENLIVAISFLSMALKALPKGAKNHYPCFVCEERVKRWWGDWQRTTV